jgi:hypothetical protein
MDEGFYFLPHPAADAPIVGNVADPSFRASRWHDPRQGDPPWTRLSGGMCRSNLYRIACCGSHRISPCEQYRVRR